MTILNLSFNQQKSHLCCSTAEGFIIYKLAPNIEKKIYYEMDGGVGIMKMLNKTNLSVMVGGGDAPFSPKDTVVLWDDYKKASVIRIELKEPVRNVLITNDKIIAVLEKKICVFDINGNIINTKPTYFNEKGICVINNNDELPIIATLGENKGEIATWRLKSDTYKTIKAHYNNITALSINDEGTLVATASEMGTNVHIFSTESGQELYKFRRGTSTAIIHDIAFNNGSSHIACCSSNGTVHFYELYKDADTSKNIKSKLASLTPYLPEYFSSQWSFSQVKIDTTSKTVCGFDENNTLHVAGYDGKYYKITAKDGEKYDQVKESNLYPNQK